MAASDPLPGPEPGETRRLTRSTTDKHIAGVAGGIGRYFGIDPLIVRIAFGVSVFLSGIGILAYLALLAFLPTDDGEPAWIEGRSRATTIALVALMGIIAVSTFAPPAFILGPGLFGLVALGGLGVLLYRAFGGSSGDDPARVIARVTLVLIVLAAALGAAFGVGIVAAIGGGTAIAVLSIIAGFGLVGAGLLGGPRWLILPAIVLVMPLAIVSAADIDLRGGVGERTFRPASVAAIEPEYRIGFGQLDLDLRDLPATGERAEVNVSVGVGEARVRVPLGACVITRAKIGVGAADLPQHVDHGIDIDFRASSTGDDTPPLASSESKPTTLVVNADIGVGHLEIEDAGSCA
jgi:phage shock protein PspC (stress-responsive transcriptional regulator)